MKDPRREYEAALADFAQPGNRWTAKGRLTYWGKAAGLTADQIISDAQAAGVTNRDADIRRGWNDASPKGDRQHGEWRRSAPRAKPKPAPTFPGYVRDLVAAGGGEATARDLIALSPLPIPSDGRAQTTAFLRSHFDPGDILFVTRKIMLADGTETALAAKPNKTMRRCAEWLELLERGGRLPGDIMKPNAITGKPDTAGKYATKGCIASPSFAVVEFDDLPLKAQVAFWRGLLTESPLAPTVTAVVFSGKRSLHGLFHFGNDTTLDEWTAATARLRGLFCADETGAWTDANGRRHFPFQTDSAGLKNVTQGVRLPGVCRISNGKLQQLLFLNPEAVRPTPTKTTVPTAHAEPRKMPSTRSAAQTRTHTTEAKECATGAEIGVLAHVSPIDRLLARDSGAFNLLPLPHEPDDDAPLDELLAYGEVLESLA